MTTTKAVYVCFLLWCAYELSACHPPQRSSYGNARNFTYSYCTPNRQAGALVPSGEALHADSGNVILPEWITSHDQRLCRELGISAQLNELTSLSKASANLPRVTALKEEIGAHIRIARVEMESIAAELDCEGERANLAATYLDDLNSRDNRKLTVASLVTGALTTVASVLINGHDGQVAVGVSGGLLSAGLALATVNPKGHRIAFYHARNLLRSIWYEPAADTVYPAFVWHMLHEPEWSNSGAVTLAESIRNRWQQFEFGGDASHKELMLLFGEGGYYHADDLHKRAAMLNQLQSTIRSINQDLVRVVEFLQRM